MSIEDTNPITPAKHRGWNQFQTLVWLRWRILKNQMAKSGQLNLILTMIIVWSCLILAALSFFIAFGLGLALLSAITPFYAMLVWDALLLAFCLAWFVGLVTELQRTEFLSMLKLLQLPMSFKGAFTLNYLTSLVSISVLAFVPTALGLSLAFGIVHGPLMLLQIPAALALVFMVSSLSYLFRTYLGAVMQNERKRRTVVVAMTLVIVATAQIPNLLIQTTEDFDDAPRAEHRAKTTELQKKLEAGEIDVQAHQLELETLNKQLAENLERARQARYDRWERYLNLANTWIPIGWPAMISKRLMESDLRMFLLGFGSMLAIGTTSLGLSYRSTLRGLTQADQPVKQRPSPASATTTKRRGNWMQANLPLLGPHPATVSMATILNGMRTPEAKMALVGPVIVGMVFLFIFYVRQTTFSIPIGLEPYALLATVGLAMFGVSFTCMNMFGMDGNAFKSLVLMPVRRQDILFGKNLAFFPVIMLVLIPMLLSVCYFIPNSILAVIATLLQTIVIYTGTCLIGNPISIWFPIPIAPGSGQPVKINFKVVVMQMLGSMGCMLLFVPAAVAIGLQALLLRGWEINYLPIYLVVSLIELAIVIPLYRWGIRLQGDLLQHRETHIIDALKIGEG